METRNDNPIADSLDYLESQGIPTDDEDDDDIHFCKKCKKVFKKLEEYLEHKVKHDKFKVTYNRYAGDRRMVLPSLQKKEPVEKPPPSPPDAKAETKEGEYAQADITPVKSRKRRRKKAPPVDIQLIAERNTYICNTCDRKFSREASLKWHIQYDHKSRQDSDEESEEDEDAGGEEGGNEEGQDENFIVKREPTPKRVKVQVGEGDRPFKCEMCTCSFKEFSVLKTHMLTHSNVRVFKCSFHSCPYSFKTKGSLVRHERRHTGERPYSCDLCMRKFAESGALSRHQRSRTPCTAKTDADLPRYGKKWAYVPNIPAAMSEKSQSGDGFANIVPGEMVMVVTEGENGEQILTEAQVVSNNETVSTLTESMEVEEGEVREDEVNDLLTASALQALTPTQCRVCKEECLEIEGLRAHLRLHLADFPYHCGLCHYTSGDRSDLHSHMQSKHLCQLKGIDPNLLLPPVDSAGSKRNSANSSKDNTDAHIAVKQLLELPAADSTEGEMTEELSARAISRCPICNRAFRGTSYLKQHMKCHTGDRPFECLICKKSFVTKDALNKHFIVHTDERNFKCGECGKLFKRIGHVREHLKIHNADRPFTCTVCDKSFKTNNAMKVHIRTHTDFFPFECHLCHRQFREKGSLQRHTRTHTGERPYRCPRCNRGFAEHGTLNRHLKAKVSCNIHLTCGDGEDQSQDSTGMQEEEDSSSVLAEFSSVVADTQQYIVADHLPEGESQTTEYVVLHTDLGSDDIQNVEIVTDGDLDPDFLNTVTGSGSESGSYVVITDTSDQLRIIDSTTGLTVATVPANSATDHMDSIAVTTADSQDMDVDSSQGSLTITQVLQEDEEAESQDSSAEDQTTAILESTEPETDTLHHDAQDGTDAHESMISAPQSVDIESAQQSISLHSMEESVVMHHSDLENIIVHQEEHSGTESITVDQSVLKGLAVSVPESITVHTSAGPVTVVGATAVADAVKQAMMVAGAMESAGNDDTGQPLHIVLTHQDGTEVSVSTAESEQVGLS